MMNAAPIVSDEAANEESVQWSQWSPELDNYFLWTNVQFHVYSVIVLKHSFSIVA